MSTAPSIPRLFPSPLGHLVDTAQWVKLVLVWFTFFCSLDLSLGSPSRQLIRAHDVVEILVLQSVSLMTPPPVTWFCVRQTSPSDDLGP